MKTRFLALLAAVAFAGWLAAPALAGEGEGCKGDKPACGAGDAGKCGDGKDGGGCKDGGACKAGGQCPLESGVCPKCEAGAAEGRDCCKEKLALRSRDLVTMAAIEGECESAKAVLASVPAEAREKFEAARKEVFEFLVKVHREIAALNREFAASCEQARAEGKEVACEMKAAVEADIKALKARGHERVQALGKALAEAVGAERIQALAAEVQKKGDVAKAMVARLQAAVGADAPKCGDCGRDGKCDKDGKCGKDAGTGKDGKCEKPEGGCQRGGAQ